MQKVTPFLWFDDNAEEAINLYVSVFKNARIDGISRYGDGASMPKGTLRAARFHLDGQQFTAFNGGPHFKFTEAISLFVDCETQEEVDGLWEKLSAGGQESRCGWLKDKFGVSWQIIPSVLGRLLEDPDPVKAQRVMAAMLQMKKIDIALLKKAYEG